MGAPTPPTRRPRTRPRTGSTPTRPVRPVRAEVLQHDFRRSCSRPTPTTGAKPAYSTVVLRNTATRRRRERLDVQRGTNEIALDLDPSQASGMSNVQILEGPSPNVMFLFANDNPKILEDHPQPRLPDGPALRDRLRRDAPLAGAGAVQSPGIIPTTFLGALPARDDAKYDLTLAKSYLTKSGLVTRPSSSPTPRPSPSTA